MLMKAGLFLLLVTVLQVSGNEKFVEPDFIENVIQRESEASPPSRIVSGWEALPGQHPHHAALRMVSPIGGVSGCGGSIVSKEWVVTAAHCTAGRLTVVVRGGVVSLTDPEYIFETTEYYNHPHYNNDLPAVVQTHDISLVKVQRPFVYSRLLKAIRVQPRIDAFRNYDGEQVYASGHGRTWTLGSVTEVLRWVYLRAVSNLSCAGTFGNALIIDTTICARFFNVTSQSTCQGDSGGPLVHVGSNGVPTLIGVTSFVAGGDFGCHSGLPGGFIRPGPYLSWFQEVTGIDFENLVEDDDSEEVTTPQPEDSEEVTTPQPEDSEEVTIPQPEDSEEVTTPQPEESEEEPDSSEDCSPEDVKPDPDDSEEKEDSDSSESGDSDDEISQLLKRLEVKVKVKVRFNKYKVKKEVEKEKETHRKHH